MILENAAMAATALAGVVIIISALAWAFKNWLKNYLQELKPNGGSSMADSVKRIEQRIDYLTKEMMDHLKGHNGN
jgi:glyoxylate utilization-related uncharacterized protein